MCADAHALISRASPGLELWGQDAGVLSPEKVRRWRRSLLDHKVVCLRGERLDPDAFERFARSFGPLKRHVLNTVCLDGHPDIMLLSNVRVDGKLIGIEDAGRVWHSDMSFDARPPAFTILHALQTPTSGGETLFVDMARVLDELDEAVKRELKGRRGVYSYVASYNRKRAADSSRKPLTDEQLAVLQDASHALVRVHPETGVPALYVNEAHTVGIDGPGADASAAMLSGLLKASTATVDYTHSWAPGDILMWDNRSVIHRATAYPGDQVRHIYRTMVQ